MTHARTIGRAQVTVFSAGTAEVPIGWVLEEDKAGDSTDFPRSESGKEVFDHLSCHIRLNDASVVIDAGPDDLAASWRERGPALTGLTSTRDIEAQLAAIGVRPAGVTRVIITHAHWDHFIGVSREEQGKRIPRFPNARHYLNRRDWERSPGGPVPDSELMACLGPIREAGLLELIDGDREIVPGVEMVHAPGESPGHSVVRVSSDGETFYALGDLVHHSAEIRHPEWTRQWEDWEALQNSRRRIFSEAAACGASAVFSHAKDPHWGRIDTTQGGYSWSWLEFSGSSCASGPLSCRPRSCLQDA